MSATSGTFPGSRVSIFGKRTFSCDLMLQGHGGLMTFGMLCRNLREASHFEAGIWLLAVHTGKLLPCSTSRDALSLTAKAEEADTGQVGSRLLLFFRCRTREGCALLCTWLAFGSLASSWWKSEARKQGQGQRRPKRPAPDIWVPTPHIGP